MFRKPTELGPDFRWSSSEPVRCQKVSQKDLFSERRPVQVSSVVIVIGLSKYARMCSLDPRSRTVLDGSCSRVGKTVTFGYLSRRSVVKTEDFEMA